MIKVVNGVKYYPVNERIRFGIESMYEHARYIIECVYPEGKISDAELDRWESVAEECSRMYGQYWLNGKDYARAKELTEEREWIRYFTCIESGMDEDRAAAAFDF